MWLYLSPDPCDGDFKTTPELDSEQESFFDNLIGACAMELLKLVVRGGGWGSETDHMEKACRIRKALGTVNV